MIETATYIGLGLVDFSKLINRTVYAPMLRHFGTTNTVTKCPRHFGTGAEVSTRHFGTSAEMSWVRSVLGPKCPYTAVAHERVHRAHWYRPLQLPPTLTFTNRLVPHQAGKFVARFVCSNIVTYSARGVM